MEEPPAKDVAALQAQVEELQKQLAHANLRANSSLAPQSSLQPAPVETHDPFRVDLHTIVIFGADGNLSKKKTFPALFALMRKKHIPANINLVGYARDPFTDSEFQDLIYRAIYNVTIPQAERYEFLSRITYQQGQFDQSSDFDELRAHIERVELAQEKAWLHKNAKPDLTEVASPTSTPQVEGYSSSDDDESELDFKITANFRHIRTFYLAVPPFLYPGIAEAVQAAGLNRGHGSHDRFILEKPFGKDTRSCMDLCSQINQVLSEQQVYRIDHYLGKELVMNVLVLRFANIAFNAIWDRNHIESVQVVCKETLSTEGRGGYFDEYGTIRDVMQNHLLQIIALVAMEQPLSLSADHIRREKVKLLDSVQALAPDDLLVGQYVSDGLNKGYLEDPTIKNKDSTTETYAAAVLTINNPRWCGVPFVLKAGKALDESKVEVRIRFRAVAGIIPALAECAPNELVIRVQPNERIYWKITSKVPGLDFNVETRRMDLLYSFVDNKPGASARAHTPETYFSHSQKKELPEAYERLILEVLRGDQTNFVHADELNASWKIFTPALHHLKTAKHKPAPYVFGSSGPESEPEFAAKYGFSGGFGNEMDADARRRPIAWGSNTEASSVASRNGSASARGRPAAGPL